MTGQLANWLNGDFSAMFSLSRSKPVKDMERAERARGGNPARIGDPSNDSAGPLEPPDKWLQPGSEAFVDFCAQGGSGNSDSLALKDRVLSRIGRQSDPSLPPAENLTLSIPGNVRPETTDLFDEGDFSSSESAPMGSAADNTEAIAARMADLLNENPEVVPSDELVLAAYTNRRQCTASH